jgi:ATP-dependent Clp protease ATP-binding subunit ClpC
MFERYSERALRSIFFAHREASVRGTPEITAEELLLAILREDKTVAMRLTAGAVEWIQQELDQRAPPKGEPPSKSVDLPISQEMKQTLEFAPKEADALQNQQIDTPHLVLSLLRVEESLSSDVVAQVRIGVRAVPPLAGCVVDNSQLIH